MRQSRTGGTSGLTSVAAIAGCFADTLDSAIARLMWPISREHHWMALASVGKQTP